MAKGWPKGVPHSEETKRKISLSKKGTVPWNKGKHGYLSNETRGKLSLQRRGRRNPFLSEWSRIHNPLRTGPRPAVAGPNNPMFGKRRPDLGEFNKRRVTMPGYVNPLTGRHLSAETKLKIANAKRGRKEGEELCQKKSQIMLAVWQRRRNDPVAMERLRHLFSEAKKGDLNPMRNNDKARLAMAKTKSRRCEEDSEYKKRLVATLLNQAKPNRVEQQLIEWMSADGLPYKYVGDGTVVIEGRCPDFINTDGAKRVIELFGDYWHDERRNKRLTASRTVEGTQTHYKKYGFDCLIIWQRELRNKKTVLDRIRAWR